MLSSFYHQSIYVQIMVFEAINQLYRFTCSYPSMDSQELCVVPKFVELEYHEQQQMHCNIKLINKLDQVISFKIKTNHPGYYLVKPMEGSIYKKDQMKILFRRKELTSQQFQCFMANPNMQAKQKFLVQIQATQGDAMGRYKKITQTSYISAKFVKNKGLTRSNEGSRISQEQQQPRIKSKLRKYKQQYECSRRIIQTLKRQLASQPITKRQFTLLLVLSFFFGFALL